MNVSAKLEHNINTNNMEDVRDWRATYGGPPGPACGGGAALTKNAEH